MRKTLLFAALFYLRQSCAQQLFFPRENYKDSVSLARAIPALAAEVAAQYKNADRRTYYDDMFRYLIVARQYDQAIAFIDSVRKGLTSVNQGGREGVGFQFEAFAKARLAEQGKDSSFESAFKRIFAAGYARLDGDGRNIVSMYVISDPGAMKKTLADLVAGRQQKDTITLQEARQLLRAYNAYNVYSVIVPLMNPIIIAGDKKKFIIDQVLIRTRDGSVLQAETGRPRDARDRLPTVFIFDIYIDSAYDVSMVKQYASRGYACVVANTRGKGLSPQSIEPFEHDAGDAYDVIDWISRQPWSNKKVGMTGGSYLGFSQWAAAKKLHPALKTIMPEVAVGFGIDYPMAGNIFTSYMLRWIHYVTNSKQTDDADFENSRHWDSVFWSWYKRGAAFRALDSIEGRPNPIFQRWLRHPSFDSYWQNARAYEQDFSRIDIPVLTTTGYYDDDGLGAMYYYRQHYLHNPHADNYLVIGPYDHGGAQSFPQAELYGYKVDPAATTFNFIDLGIKWFDYILKDSAKPEILRDKVNYEVMGANEWRHASSLAAMSNDTLTLFLGNTRVGQHYKLSDRSNSDEYINQEIDLADRTDTVPHSENFKIINDAIQLKNEISFISGPMEKPLIITGSFIASLSAVINKRDMDLVIYLYEMMPDGRYFYLASALQRASYARDRGNRQLLEPGKKESIPVDNAVMTCKMMSKGSRLVIVVGIQKRPNCQINYGTGKDVSDETIADAQEPLEIKWFSDSYVRVPVCR
jgi:putative CocE/NonD family hydrolase